MPQQLRIPDEDFNRFWAAYPRRVKRVDALKAWTTLDPSPSLIDAILTALAWQMEQPSWQQNGGQFVPYPASWIRAERWTDEPPSAQQFSASAKTAGNRAALSHFAARAPR